MPSGAEFGEPNAQDGRLAPPLGLVRSVPTIRSNKCQAGKELGNVTEDGPRLLDARIAASRRDFLAAQGAYDALADDVEKITSEFLEKFLGPDDGRSQIAKDAALETLQLIKHFETTRASLSSKVAILGQYLQAASLAQQVRVINASVSGLARSDVIEEAEPIDFLRDFSKRLETTIDDLGSTMNSATALLGSIAHRVDQVQRMATAYISTRHDLLRRFRRDHIDYSWAELRKRLAENLRDLAEEEALKRAWEVLLASAQEVFEIVLDEGWIRRGPRLVRRLKKVFKVGENELPPDKTDLMQRFLGQLRRENECLQELDLAFEEAVAEARRALSQE